jgi:putative cardiolipin synthase
MKKRDAARATVGAAIVPLMRNAQRSLEIISPYFVPGKQGSEVLVTRAKAGATVQVLTNSLAANDVASVHGGYSRHRKTLLEGGVQVWELKPLSRMGTDSSLTGSSGASLHTKALSADGTTLFVGSYNLDPRSTWLNCEQGVIVEDATLAAQLGEIFDLQTSGSRAWQVSLSGSQLQWSDGKETFGEEPQASFSQKFQAWLAKVFHLDAQL